MTNRFLGGTGAQSFPPAYSNCQTSSYWTVDCRSRRSTDSHISTEGRVSTENRVFTESRVAQFCHSMSGRKSPIASNEKPPLPSVAARPGRLTNSPPVEQKKLGALRSPRTAFIAFSQLPRRIFRSPSPAVPSDRKRALKFGERRSGSCENMQRTTSPVNVPIVSNPTAAQPSSNQSVMRPSNGCANLPPCRKSTGVGRDDDAFRKSRPHGCVGASSAHLTALSVESRRTIAKNVNPAMSLNSSMPLAGGPGGCLNASQTTRSDSKRLSNLEVKSVFDTDRKSQATRPMILIPRSGSVKAATSTGDDDTGNLSDVSTTDGCFEDVRGLLSPREEAGAPQSLVSLSGYLPSQHLRRSKTVRFKPLCKIVYYDEDGPSLDLQRCR